MQSHSKVAVLGAGSWGTALSIALARNGHQVSLWARSEKHVAAMQKQHCNEKYLSGTAFPSSLSVTHDLAALAPSHSCFLLAVPSHAFRETLRDLKRHGMDVNSYLIWATKGFDAGQQSGSTTPLLLDEVVDQELGKDGPHAIISGPSFSREVAQNLPTAIVAAGNSHQAAQFAAELFHSDYMRVYINDDLVGVQLGGAIKNVIAIAAGISDGLGFGANSRTAIITRGLAEIARLGVSMGAQKDTFLGLAAMGDLVLTCTDDQSRNRQFGLAIGSTTPSNIISNESSVQENLRNIGQEVEGYNSCKEVFKLAHQHGVEMPIVEQVYKVLFESVSAKDAVNALLSRELNNE